MWGAFKTWEINHELVVLSLGNFEIQTTVFFGEGPIFQQTRIEIYFVPPQINELMRSSMIFSTYCHEHGFHII